MPLYRSTAKVTALRFTGEATNVLDITEMLNGGGFVTATEVHVIDEFDEADDLKGPIGSMLVLDEDGLFDIYQPDEVECFFQDYEEIPA